MARVYARVIPDVKSRTLKPLLERRIVPDSIVYSDTFGSYDVLDVAGSRHLRINHARLFSEEKNHINGIENFWNQAKRHLRPNPAILLFLGVQQASQDLLRTSGPGCLA